MPPLRGSLLVETISEAIASYEGFWKPDSVANRNHNPGNLREWGDNPKKHGYASFANFADGWNALRRQVTLNIERGLTPLEFFAGKAGVYAGYAPSKDNNNPQAYAAFVLDRLQRKGWDQASLDKPLANLTTQST
jgi:hypothetical protein